MRPKRIGLLALTSCLACGTGDDAPGGTEGADTAGPEGTAGDTTSGSGDGTGEGATEGTPGYPLRLGDVRVDPNPHNVLSCVVSWRSNDPSVGRVVFGEAGSYAYQVRADVEADTQRVLVYGLKAGRQYDLRVLAEASDGRTTESDPLVYETEALPPEIVRAEVVTHDPDRVDDGWTLTNLFGTYPGSPAAAVLYDRDGEPVWYAINWAGADPRGDVDVSFDAAARTVILGTTGGVEPIEVDLEGSIVWTGPTQPDGLNAQNQIHHQVSKLASGNYLTLVYENRGLIEGDRIVELDPSGEEVWQWNAFDHVPNPTPIDWTHANSAVYRDDEGALYYSARNLNAVLKLDRESGAILWTLGANGDFSADPEAGDPWFVQQHDPQILANGNILIYDNGDTTRGWSRAVEYALDEQGMAAEIAWEYRGNPGWFTDFWGDADRVEGGNTLITAGTNVGGDRSRIFEVTPDGSLVWELAFPTSDTAVGTYKAERVPSLLEPASAD